MIVKPTLSKMLSTTQNRHPLPNAKRLPFDRLQHEHRVLHDRLQVGQGLHLPVRVGVSYGLLQHAIDTDSSPTLAATFSNRHLPPMCLPRPQGRGAYWAL